MLDDNVLSSRDPFELFVSRRLGSLTPLFTNLTWVSGREFTIISAMSETEGDSANNAVGGLLAKGLATAPAKKLAAVSIGKMGLA